MSHNNDHHHHKSGHRDYRDRDRRTHHHHQHDHRHHRSSSSHRDSRSHPIDQYHSMEPLQPQDNQPMINYQQQQQQFINPQMMPYQFMSQNIAINQANLQQPFPFIQTPMVDHHQQLFHATEQNWMPPNLPLATNHQHPSVINEQAMSSSALERLQLPADKITNTGIIPDKPYYELPAGLIVPLVPANQIYYKPIDPKDLRLPFPKFPDENFLKTIESFYRQDCKPRDNDGWDREFIDMYLKQKRALAEMSHT